MGCYDIFCPFCGLPMNSTLYGFSFIRKSKEDLFNSSELFYKNTNNKNEKIYDLLINLKKNIDIKWFYNCTLLLPDGKVLRKQKELSCNSNFGIADSYPFVFNNNPLEFKKK